MNIIKVIDCVSYSKIPLQSLTSGIIVLITNTTHRTPNGKLWSKNEAKTFERVDGKEHDKVGTLKIF